MTEHVKHSEAKAKAAEASEQPVFMPTKVSCQACQSQRETDLILRRFTSEAEGRANQLSNFSQGLKKPVANSAPKNLEWAMTRTFFQNSFPNLFG